MRTQDIVSGCGGIGLAGLALLLVACGSAGGPDDPARAEASPDAPSAERPAGKEARSIPDAEIGLSAASIFEAPAPPAWQTNEAEPGDNSLVPRPFPGSPPVIPHGVADFLPITTDDNMCLVCHEPGGVQAEGEPQPLPESHRIDQRNAPGDVGDAPAGARHTCTTCHVARTDAKPLMANSAGG